MRTRDIVNKINSQQQLNQDELQYISMMWSSDLLIKSEKYNSDRCPNCNDVIIFKSYHYCPQCGKKIKVINEECSISLTGER